MSDIQRRVVTIFEAHGANQIRAALGDMRGGFRGWRDELDRGGRSVNYLDMQMRALGTTLRYGLAGAGIYGTINLVRTLGEFQAKLGEISAIATGPGGVPIVGQQLDALGRQLIDVSNQTTEPIADLQEGVISLYSTIGDVPPNEAADMMETISKVAITAQSNVQDTTQALLGMTNAFGGSTQDLKRYGDEFFKVIQLSAGMPGSVYAQKLGALSASAALGHFTPEQMGALAIGATRFGGSPSTNMQYLAQMMMFLMHPATKEANAALAGIGLGPQQRQRLGGWETLKRFLAEVNARGGVGMTTSFAGAGDELLTQAENQGLTARDIGLSGGGSDLISRAFGRIQSQRMAAILSNLLLPSQVAGTENKTLDQYLQEISSSLGEVDTGMEKAMDYRRIVQAGNAMHNFGIEVGTAISPLLQEPAKAVTAISREFNNQTWGINTPVGRASGQQLELAAGALGVAGLLKLLRGGVRGGAGSLVRGTGIGMAAIDTLTQDGTRGSSPLNPLYVAVVYSLTGGGRGLGGGGPMGRRRIPGTEPPRAPEPTPSRIPGWMRRGALGVGGGLLLGGISGVAMGYGIEELASSFMETRGYTKSGGSSYNEQIAKGHPLLDYLSATESHGGFNYRVHHPSHEEQKIIDDAQHKKISADEAERLLNKIASSDQLKQAGATRWKGKMDVDVTVTQPADTPGTTKKTTQTITTDMFPDFIVPAPQTRGKPTTRRAGQ